MSAGNLVYVNDFGLGSFKGMPLVGVTQLSRTKVFHRREHGFTFHDLDKWTYDFARTGLQLEPCGTCWPHV